MLEELFESLRRPEQITDSPIQNKKLAFADMLAHLAFLKTLPCPGYNTLMEIAFYKSRFKIDEKKYDLVPHRNSIAIQMLFQTVDVKSILYMWKALLFDCSIILISSQQSL